MNDTSLPTIHEWLDSAKQKLATVGIDTSELDALVLLQDAIGQNKAFIFSHPENVLTKKQLTFLNKSLARRLAHEPIAYIRQKVEFYGRDFFVNGDVLVPRPETETMIGLLKEIAELQDIKSIADIGCGSGAIGITAQLEIPGLKVLAVDNDKKCLEVSEKNSRVFKTTLTFFESDLFMSLVNQKIDVVLANLPYVPNDFVINQAALHEPHAAIFGGKDGLDLYRRLFEQMANAKQPPTFVLSESLPMQHTKLNKIASSQGYKLIKTDDFIQAFSS